MEVLKYSRNDFGQNMCDVLISIPVSLLKWMINFCYIRTHTHTFRSPLKNTKFYEHSMLVDFIILWMPNISYVCACVCILWKFVIRFYWNLVWNIAHINWKCYIISDWREQIEEVPKQKLCYLFVCATGINTNENES